MRLLAAAWLLIATGCSGGRGDAPRGATVRDSAGIRVVESSGPVRGDGVFADIDSVPSLSIGVEDGDPAMQLFRVYDAYRYPDGRVAIGNSGTSEIRFYDRGGRHVRTVGGRGAGPGEFAEINTIYLHPHHDTLIATDGGAYRQNVYAPDGQFVETRPFDVTGEFSRPFMQGVFDDGSWLALGYEGGGTLSGPAGAVLDGGRFALIRYDAQGRRQNDITRAVGRPRYVLAFGGTISYPYIPLTAEPLHVLAGDEVYLLRSASPELEVYGSDGTLRRLIRWSRAQTRSAEVWDTYKARSLSGMSERQRPRYEALYDIDLPLPEFVPAYSAVLADNDGRAWIARYRLGTETGPPVWDVVGRDGTWLGSVAMPSRFTPYRIGPDHILGKHTDSLGVERVQLRSLRMR